MPDVQMALQKLNQNLDGLQVTLARANDLLNDRNRANIASSLNNLEHLVAEVRPKANESLDNLNGMLTETRPKVAASLSNVQELTTRLGPLLDALNTTTARANDTLGHVDSTLMENRSDIRAAVTGLRDTLAKSTGLLNELNQTLDQNSGNIDDLLDNLRMTTENLRDPDRNPDALSGEPDPWHEGAGPQTRRRSEIGGGTAEEQTMRFMISICLVMAGGLVGASCVSTRPVHYYTLGPAAPPANQGKPDGLILLVGNIATPEALQDGRIRYRTGSNEAGAYEYHRWTERPGSMVRNSLVRALRASGKYQRVLESGSSANGDYLVRGKLYEFGEVDDASIQTKISLQVELVDRKTNRNVWDRLVEREEPVSGKNVADVVQSLDRNLQHVVSETAEEIDKFLAARPLNDRLARRTPHCMTLSAPADLVPHEHARNRN